MIVVLETNVCVDGILCDKIEDTSIDVLAGPNLNSLRGVSNNKNTEVLLPTKDADGTYILGLTVRGRPEFANIGAIKNSGTKKLRYFNPILDVNNNEIPCVE